MDQNNILLPLPEGEFQIYIYKHVYLICTQQLHEFNNSCNKRCVYCVANECPCELSVSNLFPHTHSQKRRTKENKEKNDIQYSSLFSIQLLCRFAFFLLRLLRFRHHSLLVFLIFPVDFGLVYRLNATVFFLFWFFVVFFLPLRLLNFQAFLTRLIIHIFIYLL